MMMASRILPFLILTSLLRGESPSPKSIQAAIDQGVQFLETTQAENGSWGDEAYPAITALPITAIMRNPQRPTQEVPSAANLGYQFLLANQQEDGGIYQDGLATYNTSLALKAFSFHPTARTTLQTPVRAARQFLIKQQADFGEQGTLDSPFDGGVGYGGTYTHSDPAAQLAGLPAAGTRSVVG
ncbi:MAG: hypothetical protein AAGJ31_11970 [Verrucomicrobiota bacterium]